jgi:toxin ParE1/3/4
MATVVWSDDALADESPAGADRMLDRIQAATDQLVLFPESGRTVPDPEAATYREVFVGNYRVIYSYDRARDEVIIALVIHGRRQLPPLPPRA